MAIPSPPTSSPKTRRKDPESPTASSNMTWRRPRIRFGPPASRVCSPTGWRTAAKGNQNVEHPFPKLFTIEEANALLPKLEELLRDIAVHRDRMRKKAPHIEPILKSSIFNGGARVGSEYGVETYNLYLGV